MDNDHAQDIKDDSMWLDKTMDNKKLKETYLLLKQKMCKTHELIQRYNDKLKECEGLKTERDALKKEVRKVTYNYNTTLAKNIKLEHQNAEYRKKNESAMKTVTEHELKIAGDRQLIKQLTCKMNDLEDKHAEKILELELDRSGLKGKVKELEQELKVAKKPVLSKTKKTEKSEKNGDNIESSVSPLEQVLTNVKVTVDAATNTVVHSDPPKVAAEFSEKCTITDEFYSLKDNPYPIFCAKCETLIIPPPIEKICKVMTSCPSLLGRLSPMRPMTPDVPYFNQEHTVNVSISENQGLKSTSQTSDVLKTTQQNLLMPQAIPPSSASPVDTNVDTTHSESTVLLIKELHKKVTTLESKMKKQVRRKSQVQNTCCQNMHQHCNSFNAKDILNLPFYPPFTPDVWKVLMNANNLTESGKHLKSHTKENERKLRKCASKKVKMKNKKKVNKSTDGRWSVEQVVQSFATDSYVTKNKRIKKIRLAKKNKKNAFKMQVSRNPSLRTSTSDLSIDEEDFMDTRDNTELTDDPNTVCRNESQLQGTQTEVIETHLNNNESNGDVCSKVKKNLLSKLEEQETHVTLSKSTCLNSSEENKTIDETDKEARRDTIVQSDYTNITPLNELDNSVSNEKVQCEDFQNVERNNSDQSTELQEVEIAEQALSNIRSESEILNEGQKLKHLKTDENDLSGVNERLNETGGNSNETLSTPTTISLTDPSLVENESNHHSQTSNDMAGCLDLTDTHTTGILENDLSVSSEFAESAIQCSPEANAIQDVQLEEQPKKKRGRPPKANSASNHGSLLKKLRQLKKDSSTVQSARLLTTNGTENLSAESILSVEEDTAPEDCNLKKKRRIAHTVKPCTGPETITVVSSRTLRSHNDKTPEQQCGIKTAPSLTRNRRQSAAKNKSRIAENSASLINREIEPKVTNKNKQDLHSSIISQYNVENNKVIDDEKLVPTGPKVRVLQSTKENTNAIVVENSTPVTEDVDFGNSTRVRKIPTRSTSRDVNVSDRSSANLETTENNVNENKRSLSRDKEIKSPKKLTPLTRRRKKLSIENNKLFADEDDCVSSEDCESLTSQDTTTAKVVTINPIRNNVLSNADTVSNSMIEIERSTDTIGESTTGVTVREMSADMSTPLDTNQDSRVESSQISSSDLRISDIDINNLQNINQSSAHDNDLAKISQNIQYKHAIPIKDIGLLLQRNSAVRAKKSRDLKTATHDVKFKKDTETIDSETIEKEQSNDEHLASKDNTNGIQNEYVRSENENCNRVNDVDELASPMSPECTTSSNDLDCVKIIPTSPQRLDAIEHVNHQNLLSPMSSGSSYAHDQSIPIHSDTSGIDDVNGEQSSLESPEQPNSAVSDNHDIPNSVKNYNNIIHKYQNGHDSNPVVFVSENTLPQNNGLKDNVPLDDTDTESFEPKDCFTPKQLLQKICRGNKKSQDMKRVKKSSSNTEHIDNFVKNQLQRVLDSSEWSSAAHKDVVEKLSTICTPRVIAKNIVEVVMSDAHNKALDKTFTPPAPLMTKTQQKLLTVVLHLEEVKPTVWHFVEEGILFTLFKLNQTPKWCEMDKLTRMYVVMARVRKDREKVRIFCLDALYCLGYKATRIFEIVLTSWPEVLPVCGTQTGMLPKLIVTIIMSLQGQDVFVVKKMLTGYYKYPTDGCTLDTLLQEYLTALKAENSDALDTGLLLLAKKGGVPWTHKNVIKDGLLPMIVDGSHPDAYRAFCLLGNLMRVFPLNDPSCIVAPIIEQLVDLIESGEGSAEQQEGVASALLSLSRHNFNDTIKAVLNWTPARALTRRTSEQLNMIFVSRTTEFWKSFMRKLEKSTKNTRTTTEIHAPSTAAISQ